MVYQELLALITVVIKCPECNLSAQKLKIRGLTKWRIQGRPQLLHTIKLYNLLRSVLFLVFINYFFYLKLTLEIKKTVNQNYCRRELVLWAWSILNLIKIPRNLYRMANLAHCHPKWFLLRGHARWILGSCPVGSFFMLHVFLTAEIGCWQPKAAPMPNLLFPLPN